MTLKKDCIRFLLGLILVLLALKVHAAAGSKDADEWVYKARMAAEGDRHRESIDSYHRAVTADVTLRATVATELGHQYTWAELPESALVWYEIALDENPGDMDAKLGHARALSWAGRLQASEQSYLGLLPASGDRKDEVQVGLAKVKSWQGDLGPARALYQEVLDRDPENTEARLGLAEVTNWSGRHREAEILYRKALAEEPDNTEARKGLAYSQYWSGHSELALQTLGSGEGDLQEAVADIRNDIRPRGSNTFSFRDNSTDGDFHRFETRVRVAPGPGTEVTVSYTRGRLTLTGAPDIDRDQLAAVFQKRLSSRVAVTVSPGVQLNRFDTVTLAPNGVRNNEFNLLVWDAYATLTPTDWVRVDIGNSRQTLDIPQPTFREIDVSETSAGLDWRLHNRLITFGTLKYDRYSDTNSRLALAERVEWTPRIEAAGRWKNSFVLSEGVEYWDFEQQLDNGYFSPLTYVHIFAGLRFSRDLRPRLHAELSGRIGAEKENGEGWTNVGSFDVNVRFKAARSFLVSAGYTGSGSRLDSPDGFRSRSVFVSIDYALGR